MKKKLARSWRDLSFYLSPRYIFGVILIFASFLSAFVITQRADRTITVWSATVDLAPGSQITSESIEPMRVRLVDNAEQYLSADAEIIGASVLRGIGSAELIPAFALSKEKSLNLQRVPLSISRDRVPAGLKPGSAIDIYAIPDRNLPGISEAIPKRSKLLIAGVVIETIDNASSDIGGNLLVTLLVDQVQVPEIVDAMADSQFILVRRLIEDR